MQYVIIELPFSLDLRNLSKDKLQKYFEWFMSVIPQRTEELSNEVRRTPGYESWMPDFSPESLDKLGEWFVGQVSTRERTKAELNYLAEYSRNSIQFPTEELTDRTVSLAMDLAIYVAQVLKVNCAGLQWKQALSGKRSIDYGHVVLAGFGQLVFNPLQMMITHAYGVASKKRTGRSLRELYDTWAAMTR